MDPCTVGNVSIPHEVAVLDNLHDEALLGMDLGVMDMLLDTEREQRKARQAKDEEEQK